MREGEGRKERRKEEKEKINVFGESLYLFFLLNTFLIYPNFLSFKYLN